MIRNNTPSKYLSNRHMQPPPGGGTNQPNQLLTTFTQPLSAHRMPHSRAWQAALSPCTSNNSNKAVRRPPCLSAQPHTETCCSMPSCPQTNNQSPPAELNRASHTGRQGQVPAATVFPSQGRHKSSHVSPPGHGRQEPKEGQQRLPGHHMRSIRQRRVHASLNPAGYTSTCTRYSQHAQGSFATHWLFVPTCCDNRNMLSDSQTHGS